ncbi:DUF2092 domain-containing protein [Rhizobium binae]|uniref:DUF2092 domain-containing protein n=1 Tax=Rhizobium binae TaxID=1138190 RepID=UPI001C831D54|nr:DUF2092 domain-containing protein [Rhizobium binae]MBX4936049.1 DUF2092 domain-containing protein [Rhizobium binae]MBX4942088.1 DUF2092 domain-containing protein [Rhizobium binae]MBX4977979.1 DUF2092 domain-containing protein [Rhizobium binae]
MILPVRLTFCCAAFAASLAVAATTTTPARAEGDDAEKILKAMSDYLAAQKNLSVAFDSSIEVVTPQMEKIQFDNSGSLHLVRPDKIHATRTGGYSDVEMVFDGKTFTVFGKNIDGYIKLPAAGTVDKLIDMLRDRGRALPGADLLLSDVYGTLSKEIIDAKHIGEGVIGGVECEHLAFRQQDTDWQLWVRAGTDPIPCKMVVTSKAVGQAPQYTLTIRDWKTDVPVDDAAFTFKPPAGAKEVSADMFAEMDELPPSGSAK